jgi:pyruvate dehydrogenase E1 component beta subunit
MVGGHEASAGDAEFGIVFGGRHAGDELDARPIRLSSQDIPTPYNGALENLTIIQPHQIVDAAQQLVAGKI